MSVLLKKKKRLWRQRKPLPCGQENKTHTSLRAAWSPNVVRHHLALRAESLQAPLRCRLRQAQRGRDLLVARASGCHFFDGKEFLCGQDHSRCENAYKQLGFVSNVAVVCGCVVPCVGVLSM